MKCSRALLTAMLFMTTSAQAESVRIAGKVSEIGVSGDYLKILRLDPQTQDDTEIRIDVEEATRFRGVNSIAQIRVGDEVTVDADFNRFTHEYAAQMIRPPTV